MKSKIDKLSALKFVGKSLDTKELSELLSNSLGIFKKDLEFYQSLEKIYWLVENSTKLSVELEIAARENDFDENTMGNGYWSFIHSYSAIEEKVLKICKQLTKNRDKFLFKKKFYVK